jgi:hypothetical protein
MLGSFRHGHSLSRASRCGEPMLEGENRGGGVPTRDRRSEQQPEQESKCHRYKRYKAEDQHHGRALSRFADLGIAQNLLVRCVQCWAIRSSYVLVHWSHPPLGDKEQISVIAQRQNCDSGIPELRFGWTVSVMRGPQFKRTFIAGPPLCRFYVLRTRKNSDFLGNFPGRQMPAKSHKRHTPRIDRKAYF